MTASNGGTGGNGAAHVPHIAELRITMDLCAHVVKIDGTIPNIDCALSMLAAATRAYESQLRQAQAIEFAARAQQASENERIRSMVSGGRR